MGKDGDGQPDGTKKAFTYESEQYSRRKVVTSDEFYLDSEGRLRDSANGASQKLALEFDEEGNIVRVILHFNPDESD